MTWEELLIAAKKAKANSAILSFVDDSWVACTVGTYQKAWAGISPAEVFEKTRNEPSHARKSSHYFSAHMRMIFQMPDDDIQRMLSS